jgi:hypothetical protein
VTVDALLGRRFGEADPLVGEFCPEILQVKVAEKEW